jgi:hypothetical protein
VDLVLELPFTPTELNAAQEAASSGNAGPLRALCQREVEAFESQVRLHPEYLDGLVRIERLAVEGYLYQKIRNHIKSGRCEPRTTRHLPPEL